MNLRTFATNVRNFLIKSQKAQYSLSAAGNKDSGQEIPAQYAPDLREKIYRTPVVFMAVNAIGNQVAKVDWEIVPKRNILDQFGYGMNDGKSSAVLTTKQWTQFKQKYTPLDREKLSSTTKKHIESIYTLLNNPNENEEGFAAIIKKVAVDLKIHDAAAIEKTFNGLGEVAEIYTAPAPYIRMDYDKNGRLKNPAYIQYDQSMPNNKVASWSKEELIYMMLNPISTSMYGVSPVDIIGQTVATLVNALNYNGSYFESAAMPEGYFTLPGLTEVQARRLMQKWEQDIKSKAHKVVFMPEGAKWYQFRFSNVEMQWLQGQKFYMEIVFAVLGVTKHELGFTEDLNKAIADNQTFVFKNNSILPILNLISEKINHGIIGQSGFGYDDVMFVFKNVDLADKEALDKIHDRAVKSGRMTINETREEAGKPAYQGYGNEPVIATSQGLVFLEQFKMKFEEFKEEQEWLQQQANAAGVPVAEMRRRLQSAGSVSGSQDDDNNSDSQPKTQPRPTAPKADEEPEVDESKNQEWVDGLNNLVTQIEKIVTEDEPKKAKKSIKTSKEVSQ